MQRNTNEISQLNKGKLILISLLAVFFTALSVCTALIGVNIYKTVSSDESEYLLVKASSYITDEIRSCENKSDIRIASIGGNLPALVISDLKSTDKTTETWLFCNDGFLKEAKQDKGSEITMESAENIIPLKAVDFQMTDTAVLEISLTSKKGNSSVINLHLTGARGTASE